MAARRVDPAAVAADVAAALDAGGDAPVELVARAVRGSLALLAAAHPGHHLEVRVPPYGAVQCIEGPRHTRGTPPAVVETDSVTWLGLASGSTSFADAVADGRVRASGARADLASRLPVVSAGPQRTIR